jgi:hypothetical protein
MRSEFDDREREEGPALSERRGALERSLREFRRQTMSLTELEREIAVFCIACRRAGVEISSTIIELKRLARPILLDDPRVDRLISGCIRTYYGDVEVER